MGMAVVLTNLIACVVVSVLSVSPYASKHTFSENHVVSLLLTSAIVYDIRFVRDATNNHQAASSSVFQSSMVSAYCSYLVRARNTSLATTQ